MKHAFEKLILVLALVLALAVGAVAIAEAAEPEATPEPEAPASEAAEGEDADSTALEDALEAYYDARESSQAEDLQAELAKYVAAGKLTQEQADLILNYYKERQALRDGTCPNCGYEFQSGYGYGGRGGHGGMGGKGRDGMGGGMRGGRGGMGMYGMRGVQQSYAAGEDAAEEDAALSLGVLENPYRANFL